MDSGNSGSLQSSSGGEEEYDSSNFLNSTTHFPSIPNPQSTQILSHQQPTLYSHNLDDPFPGTGNSQFGNDLVWSRNLRSEPNYNNFGSSSSLSLSTHQSVFGTAHAQGHNHNSTPFPTSSSSMAAAAAQSVEGSSGKTSEQQPVVKNPKKRTRASRRAPTTVLTTDTTNFRQMVQEFTGIPTAPFSGSPYSRRLDLFSTGSSIRSAGGGHLDSLGSLYPLRPSAQKLQLNPFFPPSSSTPVVGSSNTINNHGGYSVTPNLGISEKQQPQNLLNIPNQILGFQSLNTTNKSQGNTSVPSFDDLGSMSRRRHHHHQENNVNANLGGFLNGGMRLNGDHNQEHDHDHMGSSSAASSSQQQQQITNYNKLINNCSSAAAVAGASATTSDHFLHINNHEKGLETIITSSSAGEGTVGSWICPNSSDH